MENIQKTTFLNKHFFVGIYLSNLALCLYIISLSPLPENSKAHLFTLLVVYVFWYFMFKTFNELKQNDNSLVLGITKYAFLLFIQLCLLIFFYAHYLLGYVYILLVVPSHTILYFIESKYPNVFFINDLLEKTK